MGKKFVLTENELNRLTSDIKGSDPNSVGLNAKEDAISRIGGDSKKEFEITFPARRSHLGPDRTIEIEC